MHSHRHAGVYVGCLWKHTEEAGMGRGARWLESGEEKNYSFYFMPISSSQVGGHLARSGGISECHDWGGRGRGTT